ncbi:hypothetical protein LTR95_002652 [Oleoguttula sp. CCFEE 5521]
MSLKIKIGGGAGGVASGQPPTPAVATPSSGGGFKLKFSKGAQSPAPVPETTLDQGNGDGAKKKRQYARKDRDPNTKKRQADDDSISPAPKRPANETLERKPSLMIKLPHKAPLPAVPAPAKTRISLKKKVSAGPKQILRSLHVRGQAPERIPGNAYDSEDSEREKDPSIEQHLVLRMQPGEDCDYLRNAINERKIGIPLAEGGADASIRFLDRDFRRALITIKGRMYAAAVVDLPNIVETMKSWDRKVFYKVSDLSQMLLVLGKCNDDHEAKSMPLPARVVDPTTMQFAHGLTPPMHWVRKRRFRKRLSYRDTANVEEEVNNLIADDDRALADGGSTTFEMISRESLERSAEPEESRFYDDEDDAEGEAMSTIENGNAEDTEQYEEEDAMGEEDMDALFDAGQEDTMVAPPQAITATPQQLQSTVTSPNGNETPTTAPTPLDANSPAGTPAQSSGDDDDDDDDEYSSDEESIVDEDAVARAAERAQQMEEIHDLEKEVELQKQRIAAQKNQLLRDKMGRQLASLEEDLRIKREGLGIGEEEAEG